MLLKAIRFTKILKFMYLRFTKFHNDFYFFWKTAATSTKVFGDFALLDMEKEAFNDIKICLAFS